MGTQTCVCLASAWAVWGLEILPSDSIHGRLVRSRHVILSVVHSTSAWADRYDVEMTQISLAWLLTKVESPIVGATKLHHIEGAVKSLDVHLTADDIRYLEEPYVPHNLSGVMAVNKPMMSEEPVWVAANRNK